MSRLEVARFPDLGSPRFELLGVLGEGGSGIVYEARVRALSGRGTDEVVALKVLRAELAPSERERRRFLEEAERMQRVAHEGLVPLLDAGLLPDGRPFLAMPRLEGETLAARLRRGPLPARTAIRWFSRLARALHALHEAGIVHRDVKPENVIIAGDEPVLLDFGIARDLDDDASTTTAEGRVRGTPAYMAPERFFGAAASVRSDVYELAVVLYMMLAGRLPWGSEKNVTERLDPKSPEEAGADVSSALARIILRALSTRPEVRPASAEAFAVEVERAGDASSRSALPAADDRMTRMTADLEIVPASRPVTSEPPRAPTPPPTSAPSRRLAAVSLALVVAAGAAFAAARARSDVAPSSEPRAEPPAIADPPVAAASPAAADPAPPPTGPPPSTPKSAAPSAPVPPSAAPAARAALPAARPSRAASPPASAQRPDEAFFEDRR